RGDNRAREAAEAAIRSPLLEDVNLHGARGILVNITAGMDLTLGEFTEVGNTIEEFASSEATVVVGTVIDPEMTDELRVTVVATGLGQAESAKAAAQPAKVVDNTRTSDGTPNYAVLDKPTVMRANAGRATGNAARAIDTRERDMEYLDIPAFLRRQAD